MALRPPIGLDAASGPERPLALDLRRAFAFLLGTPATGPAGFVADTNAMKVTQRGAGANMSVDIAAGYGAVVHTETTPGGALIDYNDAVVNVAVTAADPTNARKDLVILYHRDSFYSGANDDAQFAVVAGTPAGSPVEPNPAALGFKNYAVLAMVDVPATSTSVIDARITDRRNIRGYQTVKVLQQTATGGPTSAAAELTVATLNIPAQLTAYDLEAALNLDVTHTTVNDVVQVRIKVDGVEKATVQNRNSGSLAGAQAVSIPTSQLTTIAANTACTVTVTIARTTGVGTYTVLNTGRLTARLYFA